VQERSDQIQRRAYNLYERPHTLGVFYRQARALARRSSPEMMEVLVGLASDHEVEPRVRSVCAMAVLDRAGIRPIDFGPDEAKDEGFDFNPRDYSPEELDQIEECRADLSPPAFH